MTSETIIIDDPDTRTGTLLMSCRDIISGFENFRRFMYARAERVEEPDEGARYMLKDTECTLVFEDPRIQCCLHPEMRIDHLACLINAAGMFSACIDKLMMAVTELRKPNKDKSSVTLDFGGDKFAATLHASSCVKGRYIRLGESLWVVEEMFNEHAAALMMCQEFVAAMLDKPNDSISLGFRNAIAGSDCVEAPIDAVGIARYQRLKAIVAENGERGRMNELNCFSLPSQLNTISAMSSIPMGITNSWLKHLIIPARSIQLKLRSDERVKLKDLLLFARSIWLPDWREAALKTMQAYGFNHDASALGKQPVT